ncbi:ribonuclease HI [Elusimicrobium simillimum]|uniref:ribonuclease HI family protein n=1 Tax=Elusimicrobium simillimum TaxID=3143438 RepID=UPI003C703EAC
MKVIINIDGGSRGNPGFGASAYVIKDTSGKLLASEGKFLGVCTNNYAEFTALLIAFDAAKKLKATELQVYSDSLLLVKQFLGEYKIKHPTLKELMEEIRRKARMFSLVLINHVPREKNKEADKLANIAMDRAINPSVQKMQREAAMPMTEPKIVNHLAAPEEPETKPEPKPKTTAKKAEDKPKPQKKKVQGSEQLELF